jgi:hypothetical protein
MIDPIVLATSLGLVRVAEAFPDSVRAAFDAGMRMRAGFSRDLPMTAEPASMQPPPPPSPR